jgi:hypothetical protein
MSFMMRFISVPPLAFAKYGTHVDEDFNRRSSNFVSKYFCRVFLGTIVIGATRFVNS